MAADLCLLLSREPARADGGGIRVGKEEDLDDEAVRFVDVEVGWVAGEESRRDGRQRRLERGQVRLGI